MIRCSGQSFCPIIDEQRARRLYMKKSCDPDGGFYTMIANYHTHTWRCRHADGTEREYVETAIEAGLSLLGTCSTSIFDLSEIRWYSKSLLGTNHTSIFGLSRIRWYSKADLGTCATSDFGLNRIRWYEKKLAWYKLYIRLCLQPYPMVCPPRSVQI